MMQAIPAASIDLRMHLWYLAGLGDQIIRLELDFGQRLDEGVLARATELLLHSTPVLASY